MKSKMVRASRPSFFAALALGVLVLLTPLSSVASEKAAFAFTASLETGSTIHLGEPIVLDLPRTNLANHRLAVIDGQQQRLDDPIERQAYRPGWYGLSLKDEQGKVVANEACINPQLMQSASAYPSIGFFNPKDCRTTYCPVSRLLNITRPGNYILTVDTYLPYADASPDGVDPVTVIKNGRCVFTSSVSLALTVLPFDASHAQSVANALCRKIQEVQYDQPRVIALADALFGMPEAVASKSWYALASIPRGDLESDMTTVSVELVRLGTFRSADILADIAFSPSNSSQIEYQYRPSYLLERMYNKGDERLRTHIRLLYARHGITNVPEKFFEFTPIN